MISHLFSPVVAFCGVAGKLGSAGVKIHHGSNQGFWCQVQWRQAMQR
ncbi:hypothetical protein [Bartonella sp. AC66GZZY]